MTRDGGGWVASRGVPAEVAPRERFWSLAGLKLAEGHFREVLTAVVVRACPPRTRPTVEARFRPSHHASQARKMFATTSAARAASARPRAPRRAALPERSRARRWSTRRDGCRSPAARALRGSSLTPPRTPPRASPRAPRRHRAACVSFPAREAPRRRRPRARDGAAPAPSPAAADADPNEDDDASPDVFDMRALYGDDYDPEAFSDDSMDDDSVMDENGVRVIADVPATLLAGDPPVTNPATSPSSAAPTRANPRCSTSSSG